MNRSIGPAQQIRLHRLHTLLPTLLVAGMLACGAAPAQTQGAVYRLPGTLDKVRESGVITLAHRAAAVPFSYYDHRKRPIGYAMDLCARIVEATRAALGLARLEVRYLPVDGLTRIAAIADGKADLECGSTTNNAERRKRVAFTVPHFIAGVKMLTRAGAGVADVGDLRGQAIATTRGTTSVALLKQRNAQAAMGMRLVEAASDNDGFALLAHGRVAAFVMDDVLLYSLRAHAPRPEQFEVVGNFLSIEPLAIMLRRDDPQFKALVDHTMKDLIASGRINAIYRKWFAAPIAPYGINLNLPMSFLLRDSFRFPSDQVAD